MQWAEKKLTVASGKQPPQSLVYQMSVNEEFQNFKCSLGSPDTLKSREIAIQNSPIFRAARKDNPSLPDHLNLNESALPSLAGPAVTSF